MTGTDIEGWVVRRLRESIRRFLEKHPEYAEGISFGLDVRYFRDEVMVVVSVDFDPDEVERYDLKPIGLVYEGVGRTVEEAFKDIAEVLLNVEDDLRREVES
ncbi:MAG: hypothetical protein QXI60_11695 [Thermofilaceae archaeon]